MMKLDFSRTHPDLSLRQNCLLYNVEQCEQIAYLKLKQRLNIFGHIKQVLFVYFFLIFILIFISQKSIRVKKLNKIEKTMLQSGELKILLSNLRYSI